MDIDKDKLSPECQRAIAQAIAKDLDVDIDDIYLVDNNIIAMTI